MRVYSTSGQGFKGLRLDKSSFLRITLVVTLLRKFSRYRMTLAIRAKTLSFSITGYSMTEAMIFRRFPEAGVKVNLTVVDSEACALIALRACPENASSNLDFFGRSCSGIRHFKI